MESDRNGEVTKELSGGRKVKRHKREKERAKALKRRFRQKVRSQTQGVVSEGIFALIYNPVKISLKWRHFCAFGNSILFHRGAVRGGKAKTRRC